MKKQFITLTLLGLLLTGCGQSSSSEKESGKETESNKPSDKESENTSDVILFDTPKTVTALFDYVNQSARALEMEEGILFDREYQSYELGYYTYLYKEITEEGESFLNDTLFVTGSEKKTTEYDYKDDVDVVEDSYLKLHQIDGNDYYEILDYADGKENDKAEKEDVLVTNRDSYKEKTSLGCVDALYTFYKTNVSKNIISGVDDITPTIEEDAVNYRVTEGWIDKVSDSQYTYSAIIELSFDKKGRLTSYTYDFKESLNRQDENGNFLEEADLISSVKETASLEYGTKLNYDIMERQEQGLSFVDPSDYFLTDYTPVLEAWDGVSTESETVKSDAFPIGRYVRAKANDLSPEKALDTALTVTESTDQKVISVSSYGVVKAIGLGTTTLTIESESGVTKKLTVTVVSPSLTSIEAHTYSTYHFKGETEALYIYKNPSNSLDEIEVVSLTPTTVEIVSDKDGDPALSNLAIGEAKVLIKCKSNPEVHYELSYMIQEKKTAEEVKKAVIGTWKGDLPSANNDKMIKDAATVIYNEDGTGSLTINSENTGYTFEVGKAYPFTYQFLEEGRYLDRPVSLTMSTIILDHGAVTWTYSSNAADFYATGENANIIFATGNSEEYGAMVQLKARKVA